MFSDKDYRNYDRWKAKGYNDNACHAMMMHAMPSNDRTFIPRTPFTKENKGEKKYFCHKLSRWGTVAVSSAVASQLEDPGFDSH